MKLIRTFQTVSEGPECIYPGPLYESLSEPTGLAARAVAEFTSAVAEFAPAVVGFAAAVVGVAPAVGALLPSPPSPGARTGPLPTRTSGSAGPSARGQWYRCPSAQRASRSQHGC